MNYSYISLLCTDGYLDGVLVLYHSLMKTNPEYPFLLLVTPNISQKTLDVLSQHKISYKRLDQTIENPKKTIGNKRWNVNYSKLHIFNQTQFEKMVFLDADMLILRNIDGLFGRPHMSAVNSGGMLPSRASWIDLNSGLLVVTPSSALFNDMLSKVGNIEGEKAGGDQAFLHSYLPKWPEQKELHLDHGYNIFHTDLDEYHRLFDYGFEPDQKSIYVLHFVGEVKPWQVLKMSCFSRSWHYLKVALKRLMKRIMLRPVSYRLEDNALQLWLENYSDIEKTNLH